MRTHVLVILLFLISSCSDRKETSRPSADDKNQQVVYSQYGAVATAHPLATNVAVSILESGGNAIDAAVAAAFTLSVVEPSMSGLGGRLQAIVRREDGKIYGVDATTQAGIDYDPTTAPRASYGYPVIGVPGVVRGLEKLMKDHGSMEWGQVIKPAIEIAENGFQILRGEALRHSFQIDEIREFPGTRKYFLNGDTTYTEGSLWVQSELANTLRLIADLGADEFYTGSIGRNIVQDVRNNGGTLSMEALAEYKARDSHIVTGNYRGYDLHGLYMPSYGAITIEMLHIMEQFDLSEDNSDWARWVFEANREAYRDRRTQTSIERSDTLTSKAYSWEKAEKLKSTQSAGINSGVPESWLLDGHTTHLSVADKEGNMVGLTQSLGPNMGSRVATEGLGFLYATTLGGYLGDFEPGQRASSHISPFIVTIEDQPFMVLGAAGGSRIVTAVAQTISRVIDQQMNLDEALAAGRVHTGDTVILLENHPGLQRETVRDGLIRLGYEVMEIDQPGRFGRVHAILYDREKDRWVGAADPDWEGTASSPDMKQ